MTGSLSGPVTVRFAPSPTGSLHAGGARTALFNFLLHLRLSGRCILRIEDTDRAREVAGAIENLRKDLDWLGLKFTEGISLGGEFAPYLQSERASFHVRAAEKLEASKAAYRCFCTPERIEALRKENTAAGRPPRYDRNCRSLAEDEKARFKQEGRTSVLRLAVEPERKIVIDDLIKGETVFSGEHLDDPILVRSDGSATGLFAGAVDDYDMQVSHILRGDEWLPSTPYQFLIFEALGGPIPLWGHLSLLVDQAHAKLSKRSPGMTISELRNDGILPEAICRYIAGLGRSTLPEERGWSLADLASDFDPTSYRSGEVVYSKETLLVENERLMKRLTPAELMERFKDWSGGENDCFGSLSAEEQMEALMLASESTKSMSEARAELLALTGRPELDRIQWQDFPESKRVIPALLEALVSVSWDESALGAAVSGLGKALGIKGKDLYFPIRLAITGQNHGPRLVPILLLLGKDEVLARIEEAKRFFYRS